MFEILFYFSHVRKVDTRHFIIYLHFAQTQQCNTCMKTIQGRYDQNLMQKHMMKSLRYIRPDTHK